MKFEILVILDEININVLTHSRGLYYEASCEFIQVNSGLTGFS